MAKNILISGQSIGKTSLLETILRETSGGRSGFITRRMITGEIHTGYTVITDTDANFTFADVTFTKLRRVGKFGVNIQRFNSIFSSLTDYQRDNYRPFLYMDEIGAMQLTAGIFPYFVRNFLNAPNPFIGTIPAENVYKHKFIDEIKSRADVTILELTQENRSEVYSIIKSFLKGYS